MPIKVVHGGKGASGLAEVTVTSNKVRVVFVETGQVIDILREDAPDYMISGRQIVSLSSDNNKIFNGRPAGGSHVCKFMGFASKDAEPPTPRKIEAKTGTSKAGKPYKIPEHLEFTAIFQVQSGKWKNYQLSTNLFYAFLPFEGVSTLIQGPGSQKLEEFLLNVGLDFAMDDIPFSENVLPYLEKLILSKDVRRAIQLKPDGWIDTIGDVPEMEEVVTPVAEVQPEKKVKVTSDTGKPDILVTVQKMVDDGIPGAKEMLEKLQAQGQKTAEQLVAELGYD